MKLKNKYFLLRHGESLSNKYEILSSWPEKKEYPLTEKGRKQIEKIIPKLKDIDLIFSSDILRAKQTAEIISFKLNKKIKYDKRLREIDTGIFNGEKVYKYYNFFKGKNRFIVRAPKGENYRDVKKRILNFLKFLEKKYKNKNILIISHQLPLSLLEAEFKGIKEKDFFKKMTPNKKIKTGELRKLN